MTTTATAYTPSQGDGASIYVETLRFDAAGDLREKLEDSIELEPTTGEDPDAWDAALAAAGWTRQSGAQWVETDGAFAARIERI